MRKDGKGFKLLAWAQKNAPKALDLVGDVTGIKALNRLGDLIGGENPDNLSAEDMEHARQLKKLDMEELALTLADVANARSREVEIAKTGKADWMMYVAGCVALLTFMVMVWAVIFVDGMQDNSLFHQLMGIIEGVAMTIFAYYFGTSKSGNDKTKMLGR